MFIPLFKQINDSQVVIKKYIEEQTNAKDKHHRVKAN